MGTLRSLSGAEATQLAARVLVGRAPHCSLPLDHPRVSGEHATLLWQGDGWQVRDLGSRNGTFVDGRRLASGESAGLAVGCHVVFGDVGFEVIDLDPPGASATATDGRQVVARGGVLTLPDAEEPETTVFFGRTGWLLEDESGPRPAPPTVLAGGLTWRLELPEVLPATVEAASTRLSEVDLALAVSRDEEFVETTVTIAGTAHRLEFRAHHYLLATLARIRLADPESGWVDAERLSRMMALDRRPLNVQVFRARQELADLGVQDASNLIERRVGAALRLGTTRVVVTMMA